MGTQLTIFVLIIPYCLSSYGVSIGLLLRHVIGYKYEKQGEGNPKCIKLYTTIHGIMSPKGLQL